MIANATSWSQANAEVVPELLLDLCFEAIIENDGRMQAENHLDILGWGGRMLEDAWSS